MCNLYRVKANQESIRDIVGIMQERLNLEPDVEVYPDRSAPVVRNGETGRELVGLTWGVPSPQKRLGTGGNTSGANRAFIVPAMRATAAGLWLKIYSVSTKNLRRRYLRPAYFLKVLSRI